jgi:hypothetical protein
VSACSPDADGAAIEHLHRAVRLIDTTDSPIWRTDVRLRVAETLGPSRREEAISLAEEAGDLARANGAAALEEESRRLLDELRVSP